MDDPQWIAELFPVGAVDAETRAVVGVSSHWEQAPAAVSGTAAGTPLYYDFSTFTGACRASRVVT